MDDGAAVGVDGDLLVPPDGAFDITVQLGSGELRPGLINPHDHLHRNHYPRLGSPPYTDAYEWGRDLHARYAADIARAQRVPRLDALLFGALKNLISGVTTVLHHDPWEAAFERGFPVRMAQLRTVHSLRNEPMAVAGAHDFAGPFSIHISEGVTGEMAEEVRELDRLGLLDARLIAVHAVGVDADGIARLASSGAAVVWCPTSNEFLFGLTVPTELLTSGVDVLLGSDSLLTAEGTLLDELRTARNHGGLGDDRLMEAVGGLAARRLGLPAPALSTGSAADILYLRRPLLEATAEEVGLVIVRGVPQVGDEIFTDLFDAAGVVAERLVVGTTVKIVAAPLAAVADRILAEWPESGRIFSR